MDKIQTLVASARFAMAILGNAQGEFALAHFGPDGSDAAKVQADLISTGMRFYGVLAVDRDGTGRAGLAVPIEGKIISELAAAFVTRFERVVELVERDGESVMWLESLHALPDTRPA